MAGKRRTQKLLFRLGVPLVVCVLTFLALPFWFPWLSPPLASRFGIHYAKYERAGYGQFILKGVTFTNEAISFHAEQVEALLPTVWMWTRWRDRNEGTSGPTYLSARDWTLEFTGTNANTGGQGTAISVYTNIARIEAIFSALRDWVPKAALSNGVLHFSSERPQIDCRLRAVSWVHGKLSAEMAWPGYDQTGTLRAKLAATPYEIRLDSSSLHLTSVTRVSSDAGGVLVQSTNDWRSNRVEATAQFARHGVLPQQAVVHARELRIPAGLLGLAHFEDLTGSFLFDWSQSKFALEVMAEARPQVPTNAPPINLQIHSTGNIESAWIDKAKITSPWLQAELTPGTEIKFTPPFLRQEAVLKLALNLSGQRWVPVEGTLEGQMRFRPAQTKFPATSFAFSGSGIAAARLHSTTAALNGEFSWPRLDIARAQIGFADGSSALLTGRLDVEKRIVEDGHLQCAGSFARPFLPAGYRFEGASLDIRFAGQAQTLSHSGQLKVQNLVTPDFAPLRLRAEWKGEGLSVSHSEVTAMAGKSALELGGSLGVTNQDSELLLDKLTLRQDQQPVLQLQQPCHFSMRRPQSQMKVASSSWLVKLSPFHWLGANQEVKVEGEVDWPRYGKIAANLRSVQPGLWADFLKVEIPSLSAPSAPFSPNWRGVPEEREIKAAQSSVLGALAAYRANLSLSFSADWTNGPAIFALESSAAMVRQGVPVSAEASMRGDGHGILLKRLAVVSKAQPVLSAEGFLPLTIAPGESKQWLNFLAAPPLQLRAMTQTNSPFWEEITAWTGVGLQEPQLSMDVSGTWAALRGRVELHARELVLPRRVSSLMAPLPLDRNGEAHRSTLAGADASGERTLKLQDVQLLLELDRELARVRNLAFRLEGQPVSLTGEAPLGERFWKGLQVGQPRLDWEKASAQLRMENAQLAAFAWLWPKIFTPEGTLNLELVLKPGVKLQGALKVNGASTRPLGTFGVIREIHADAQFQEHTLDLKGITASIGGAPVSATGRVDFGGAEWLKGALPAFQLDVHGLNVPLAREPDFIVRSDLDLKIVRGRSGPAEITGSAQLRESFYLSDLQDLISGVNTPSPRPPYFSVEAEPWAQWRLNLALKGDRFLKVNSPLFKGTASADLKLGGTLKDPIATGNLKIDSGTVQFPFGNLNVTQGFVTLTSENPYRPQLLVTASARNAGYDVKMDLTGPADQPLVQFSSTPPLGSEQIVLMLTAGVFPQNEFSLTAEQRAGRVALFFGKNLLSQIGLGGGGDRLTVRTGENASDTGKPTYHVEYKLSSRWYLVGEYDQFNEFNAGLRWKIYSK